MTGCHAGIGPFLLCSLRSGPDGFPRFFADVLIIIVFINGRHIVQGTVSSPAYIRAGIEPSDSAHAIISGIIFS